MLKSLCQECKEDFIQIKNNFFNLKNELFPVILKYMFLSAVIASFFIGGSVIIAGLGLVYFDAIAGLTLLLTGVFYIIIGLVTSRFFYECIYICFCALKKIIKG
jgi:hypothetical protein